MTERTEGFEPECLALRAEVERLRKQWDEHCAYHGAESPHALDDALNRASDAESHCKSLAEDRTSLRAEAEWVRAELAREYAARGQDSRALTNRVTEHAEARWVAESRLAAANELLERASDEITSDIHDDPVTIELAADIRAHLAAQPAAAPIAYKAGPYRPDVCEVVDPQGSTWAAPTVMRAAVTAEQAQQDALHALNRRYHRHEAEQRVLDAMAAVSHAQLMQWFAEGTSTYDLGVNAGERLALARTELARRGLKP
jgi:hypothetical protein